MFTLFRVRTPSRHRKLLGDCIFEWNRDGAKIAGERPKRHVQHSESVTLWLPKTHFNGQGSRLIKTHLVLYRERKNCVNEDTNLITRLIWKMRDWVECEGRRNWMPVLEKIYMQFC